MNWGELYTHLIACTGWTWDYIENQMDIPRLASMNSYWAKHPPLHVMVQWFMGIEEKSVAGDLMGDDDDEDDLLTELSSFPQG